MPLHCKVGVWWRKVRQVVHGAEPEEGSHEFADDAERVGIVDPDDDRLGAE